MESIETLHFNFLVEETGPSRYNLKVFHHVLSSPLVVIESYTMKCALWLEGAKF